MPKFEMLIFGLKRHLFFLIALLVIYLLTACKSDKERDLHVDVSKIVVDDVNIRRYEQALFTIHPDTLQAGLKAIAPQFPVFLDVDLDDTLNIIQLRNFVTDPVNIDLYEKVSEKYADLQLIENEFSDAFRHFLYYFPDKEITAITSYVSGLMYELPVQFFDKQMIIALDMYLGDDPEIYRKFRFPLYRIERMRREYIVRDGIYDFYYYHFIKKPGENFLEKAISNGKQLYFMDAVMPDLPDHIKIGFPEEKLQWCFENEQNIWAFLVQNDLLYASDAVTLRKFFADGPFTSQFGQQSPARIGEWIGWQIVRSYMNNNRKITLRELIENDDFQSLFKASAYKPER